MTAYNLYKGRSLTIEHFLEWKKFFEEKHDEIVVQELTAKLDKLSAFHEFKAFGSVLVKALGMEGKCFPYTITDSYLFPMVKIMEKVKNN